MSVFVTYKDGKVAEIIEGISSAIAFDNISEAFKVWYNNIPPAKAVSNYNGKELGL